MKKMMKMMLFVAVALAVMNAGFTDTTTTTTTTPAPTKAPTTTRHTTIPTTTTRAPTPTRFPPPTPGSPASDLSGKMVTLTLYRGGISFYPPRYSPPSPPPYYPTPTPYYPTPTPYYPWRTTAAPNGGVSMCVRYLTDFMQGSTQSIFSLSPSSRTSMKLSVQYSGIYSLYWDRLYEQVYLSPRIRLWPNMSPDLWTRVCLVLDFTSNQVQVFSGGNMSMRKVLPFQYVWSGEPVMDFTGFDGQVTDVQMWDYSVNYREIYNYMMGGYYRWSHGSVITWSNVAFSLRGNTLLENSYEFLDKRVPTSRKEKKEKKEEKEKEEKIRRFLMENGTKERNRRLLLNV